MCQVSNCFYHSENSVVLSKPLSLNVWQKGKRISNTSAILKGHTLVLASIFAPLSSKSRTMFVFPLLDATCNGVIPFCNKEDTDNQKDNHTDILAFERRDILYNLMKLCVCEIKITAWSIMISHISSAQRADCRGSREAGQVSILLGILKKKYPWGKQCKSTWYYTGRHWELPGTNPSVYC